MAASPAPHRFDFVQIIGDSMNPATFSVTEDDAAYSLAGASGVCKVRSEAGVELLAPAVTIVGDGTAGQFTISDTASNTTEVDDQRASYSVRITFEDASVRTLVEGTVTFRFGAVR